VCSRAGRERRTGEVIIVIRLHVPIEIIVADLGVHPDTSVVHRRRAEQARPGASTGQPTLRWPWRSKGVPMFGDCEPASW
jgi:hypothetical protein